MELEPGVRQAADKVRELGKQDGNEHMVVLRDGVEVLTLHGDKDSIRMNDYVSSFKPGDVLVHNHPHVLNSLSNMDFLSAKQINAKCIYAVTEDSIYRGNLIDKWMSLFFANMKMENTYLKLLPVFEQPLLTVSAGALNTSHWLNVELAKQGEIEYSFELGPKTQAMVDEVDRLIKEQRYD